MEQIKWLWLLLPVALLGFYWLWTYRNQWLALKKAFGLTNLNRLIPGYSFGRSLQRRFLLLGSLVFFVLAMANPRQGTERGEIQTEVVNVVLALDLSYSMNARDRIPDRLEFARQNTLQLLENLRGNYFAFMPFAGVAQPEVPLTSDVDAVRGNIRSARAGMMPVQGTSFAHLLDEAYDYLERHGSGVLVVVTDGEDHGPDYSGSLSRLVESRFPVFGILVGETEGAPIPVDTHRGEQYRRDVDGGRVFTKMEREALLELSEKTGGYVVENPDADDLVRLADRIHEFRERGVSQGTYRQFRDFYPWLLGLGLVLLGIYGFLPEVLKGNKP